jgi:ABC-type amino acid transport substrate-binding protein
MALIYGIKWLGRASSEYLRNKYFIIGVVSGLPLGSSSELHEGFNSDIGSFLHQRFKNKKLIRSPLLITELDEAIQNDKVDIVCASMNITEQRLKKIAMVHLFTGPSSELTVLFWDHKYKNQVKHCKHLRDLNDFFEKHAVGVVGGTVFESVLKEYGIKNIKTLAYEHLLMVRLIEGEVGAMIVGRLSADCLLKQNPKMWDLKVIIDKPYTYGIGIALHKDRKDLIKEITDAIQELKSNGTINSLQMKWFGKVYN